MNILNLLRQKKNVVGIEISDSLIRIAFYRRLPKNTSAGKKTKTTPLPREELVLLEESIPPNIIIDGVVADQELLAKTLSSLRSKIKLDTNYAVVSIPDDKIYSRVFSFPKSVTETRIPEAMKLAINFQLPAKTENIYLDWERAPETPGANEILLSTIDRKTAHGFVEALEKAGWKTLALESHLASIARAIKPTPNQISLFTKKSPDGVTVFALRNGILSFSRTLPSVFIPAEKVEHEVQNIKSALESTSKIPVIQEQLEKAQVRDDYAKDPALTEPKANWLIVLGALIRGRIPEGQDNLISLLPVGTEEAYAYQKAVIFTTFFRNITLGVSLFFIASYLGAYVFILSLSQNVTKTLTALSVAPPSPELVATETLIQRLNGSTQTAEAILKETALWSKVLKELQSKTIENITITNLTTAAITEKMSIVGISRDRDTLNQFKKSLQTSTLFTDIELPLTNLDQKAKIPFSISLRLKDPRDVYYKK